MHEQLAELRAENSVLVAAVVDLQARVTRDEVAIGNLLTLIQSLHTQHGQHMIQSLELATELRDHLKEHQEQRETDETAGDWWKEGPRDYEETDR
ncbi:hypothetical protein ETAA8_28490 [Anatilimnocola aggregata]|uniref:Uncharacterized protein n=1 Tax=Anatilimnocola aggregata TaxID=2528021 RepID=A0A517YC55_9BACT|nr:hypothetical protein [Anatilimnocola aggregata]QDU27759.1 hypothetical protein ETAA8_28490 [Anatilimnocola aggregata]